MEMSIVHVHIIFNSVYMYMNGNEYCTCTYNIQFSVHVYEWK